MSKAGQTRLFNGEGFFEDSFAPMPASMDATRVSIHNHLKAARTSTDLLLDKIDDVLEPETPPFAYESPPEAPRPERRVVPDDLSLPVRILAITAIEESTGQTYEEITSSEA